MDCKYKIGQGVFDMKHAQAVQGIVSKLSQLTAEMRKLEAIDSKRAENMSLEKRLELFKDFVMDLPEEYQKQTIQDLTQRYNSEGIVNVSSK